MLNQHFAKLEEEKKRIKESLDEESKHKVETAIALAKVEWFAVSRNSLFFFIKIVNMYSTDYMVINTILFKQFYFFYTF